jgi:hypothetical protein
VRIPQWLTLLVALVVLGFGVFRVWLSFKPEKKEIKTSHSRSVFAGGFARMGKRTHLFVGIIYVLLGVALIATSFGFNPLGDTFGSSTETPSKDNAPVKPGTIPIDRMPKN